MRRIRTRARPPGAQAVRHLEAYPFPGNVTELEAIVMRATAQVAAGAEVNADVFWFAAQVRWRRSCNTLNPFPDPSPNPDSDPDPGPDPAHRSTATSLPSRRYAPICQYAGCPVCTRYAGGRQ